MFRPAGRDGPPNLLPHFSPRLSRGQDRGYPEDPGYPGDPRYGTFLSGRTGGTGRAGRARIARRRRDLFAHTEMGEVREGERARETERAQRKGKWLGGERGRVPNSFHLFARVAETRAKSNGLCFRLRKGFTKVELIFFFGLFY